MQKGKTTVKLLSYWTFKYQTNKLKKKTINYQTIKLPKCQTDKLSNYWTIKLSNYMILYAGVLLLYSSCLRVSSWLAYPSIIEFACSQVPGFHQWGNRISLLLVQNTTHLPFATTELDKLCSHCTLYWLLHLSIIRVWVNRSLEEKNKVSSCTLYIQRLLPNQKTLLCYFLQYSTQHLLLPAAIELSM